MDNPYQSTSAGNSTLPNSTQHLVATQTALYQLSGCKGWVRFMSVLMFIMFAFFVLAFIGMISMFATIGSSSSSYSSMGSSPMNAGIIGILIMLIYGAVIFMLGLRLSKFSSAIGRLMVSRHPQDLETAMVQQMKFWRICGVLVLIGLIFAILGMILPAVFSM